MLEGIFSAVRKTLEYFGLVSKPYWELTEEEEELARRLHKILKEETVVYQERQGHVTQKSDNAIELNHRWIYQLVHDTDLFAVGDHVSWREYRTGADTVIKDVVRVEDKGNFEETHISGVKIVKIEDAKYETNIGVIFQLKDVRCDLNFRPELLDFVNLECSYPKMDGDTAKPDPSFMVVKRVSPCDPKLVTGKITAWDASKSTGVVNNQVVFHQNACDNITPTCGARVVCNCIRGEYDGGFGWRAYNMTMNSLGASGNQKYFFVVEPVPNFQVVLGESKVVELRVSNHSGKPIIIEDVNFVVLNRATDVPHKMNLPYHILPETTVSWPIEVKGSKLGTCTMRIEWKLAKKMFPIKTIIRYTTVQQHLNELPSNRLRRSPLVMPAQSRRKNPIYRRVPMKSYAVPDKLRDLCPNVTTLDWTELQIALQREKQVLAEGLTQQNYGEYMHTMLFLEELAQEDVYDKMATRASLYRTKEAVVFNFPADSEYSNVVCGDMVSASKPWENIKYEARVCEISSMKMYLKFNADFENSMTSGALYDLEFRMNRASNRRRHQAIDLVLENLGAEWLFPSEYDVPSNSSDAHIENWCNPDLNAEQRCAVRSIIAKKNLPFPYIIYGPPGTGKTVTVVESILQITKHQSDYRLMVTAPTNSAVDTLGLRLLEFGLFDKSQMVRLTGYNAYVSGAIAAELVDIAMVPTLADLTSEAPLSEDSLPVPAVSLDDIGRYKIVLGTLTTVSSMNTAGIPKGFFTHIIIDEAGQCHEPDTLLPIALVDPNKTQLVLAGDPQQLGPVTKSVVALKYSYNVSFLARLIKSHMYKKNYDNWRGTHGYNSQLITRLVTNYRSLPKIVDVIGTVFYGGDLWATASETDSREALILKRITIHQVQLKDCMESMVFINVNTPEEQVDGSMSWYNQGEIAQVFFALNFLYYSKVSPDDIGIITPYCLQVKKIYEYLETLNAISPKVGSVEEFQGQERDVVILSLVRNTLGSRKVSHFLTDPHRVNVALSRARVLNIIIGNLQSVKADPLWAQIISKCRLIDIISAPSVEDTVD